QERASAASERWRSKSACGAEVVAGRFSGGWSGVDRHCAGRVEHLVVGRPLTGQVALPAVDVLPHAGAVLADLVGALCGRIPPDRSGIVDAEVVLVGPISLVAIGE